MVAVYYHCQRCGTGYKRPDEEDLARYQAIKEDFARRQGQLLLPRSPIPPGYNTNQMLNYNYRFWHQMFNPRQLLGLSALLSAILALPDQNIRECFLLLFSSVLEFNNLFCSAKGLGTGAIRHVFAHHAFIPAKEPLEANLWGVGRSSGGFATLYRERLRRGKEYGLKPFDRFLAPGGAVRKVTFPHERMTSSVAKRFEELISPDKRVLLLNRSSESIPELPDKSIDAVITDPPYLDNVMYSELSDFFYVWLRLGLAQSYPFFQDPFVDRRGEIIKNVEQGKGTDFYEAGLQAVFCECYRVLKDDGLLVFTFHHGSAEAWDALARALRAAGFAIQCFYPIHAEMDVGVPILGKRSVKFDAILVCRKEERGERFGEVWDEPIVLAQYIQKHLAPFLAEMKDALRLSDEDKESLALAAMAMLYTQRRTSLLPSAVDSEIRRALHAVGG